MKNLIILVVTTLLLGGCAKKPSDTEAFFHNMNGTVVIMNEGSHLQKVRSGKTTYLKPTDCMTALVRDNTDTTQCFELSSCELEDKPALVDRKWFYNHQEGDVVHFDYIRKDRYFTVTSRE